MSKHRRRARMIPSQGEEVTPRHARQLAVAVDPVATSSSLVGVGLLAVGVGALAFSAFSVEQGSSVENQTMALESAAPQVPDPSPTARSTATGTVHKIREKITDEQLSSPENYAVVVNKTRPVDPIDWAPGDLVEVEDGFQLREKAAEAYKKMSEAASKDGIDFQLASTYRSYDYQTEVHDSLVQTYGNSSAEQTSAKVGHSEHQLGLAFDIGGGDCQFESCFAEEPSAQWLAKNAHSYGFIMRYPKDMEHVTGYRYEPWHFRYVGKDIAEAMVENDIKTLEEFFELPAAPDYPEKSES